MLAMKSGTSTGESLTKMPSLSEAPSTWPPAMPVPASVDIDFRSSPEFAGIDHARSIEHAALSEIFEQYRVSLLQFQHALNRHIGKDICAMVLRIDAAAEG